MEPFIPMVKIHDLNSLGGMIHGFSQRYFETSKKEKNELKLDPLDETKTTREHTNWLLKSLNADASEIYFLKQVHSDRIYVLNDPSTPTKEVFRTQADAIVTHLVNKPIGVLTADCIPVIVHDPRRNVVGVIHAGRKGTAVQILKKTVNLLEKIYKSNPRELRVGLGPGIGPCCYEVGEYCLDLFRKNYSGWEKLVRASEPGKFFLDLFRANFEDARKVGLLEENIFVSGHCTACDTMRFHSYRKEGSACGRNVALVMLTDKP